MTFRRKSTLNIILTLLILSISCFGVSAVGDRSVSDRLYDNAGGIISVSHRGNTAEYPANSLEAIASAIELGADMVSVSVAKTGDGVLMLCEEGALSDICDTDKHSLSDITYSEAASLYLYRQPAVLSEYKMPTLEQALSLGEDNMLILDFDWALADELYSFLLERDALSRVLLRTDISAGKTEKWLSAKQEKPLVLGIYDDNIVFTAIAHIEKLSALGMPAVQYESKNYFNVIFGDFTAKHYSADENSRAVAAFYDRDLCGQRSDGEDGWNELIKRGFSVIETNNIASLTAYISEGERLRVSLEDITKEAAQLDLSIYSEAGADKLSKALKQANTVLGKSVAANDEMQSAQSDLLFAMDCLTLKAGEDTQRGALNITFGKVIAVVLVGGALLAAQIFVHKMQKGKKEKK